MTTRLSWILSALVCGSGAMFGCKADTVFLTDGREINGTVVSDDGKNIVIKTVSGKTMNVRRADIDTIVRDKPKEVKVEEPKTPVVVTPVAKVAPVTPAPKPADGSKPPAKAAVVPPVVAVPEVPVATAPPVPKGRVGETPPEPAASITNPNVAGAPDANPMPGFPDGAKRMSKRKEALLRDAFETIKATYQDMESPAAQAALVDIQGLGAESLPYMWAGIQHDNAEVRRTCMTVIGKLNGRNCIKRVIETFYATMPEASIAAIWNVPFVQETMTTVSKITGQPNTAVEARRIGVQDDLKKHIAWYNANYKSLPRQIGEPELDVTDADFEQKLKELRQLKLVKHEWPRPEDLPTDNISGPNKTSPEKEPAPALTDITGRDADKKFQKSIPTVEDNSALQRPSDVRNPSQTGGENGLKRSVDLRNEEAQRVPANAKRDQALQKEPDSNAPDPLLRPSDIKRQQENNR